MPCMCLPPLVCGCSDVQKVEIPDLNLGGGGGSPAPSSPTPSSPTPSSPAPSSPTPSSPTPEPSTPAPPPCDKTFAQVAGETSGLGLLSTVLAQQAYASALPDPAYPYTLFAPTDAAFFDLLSTFSEWRCCCGACLRCVAAACSGEAALKPHPHPHPSHSLRLVTRLTSRFPIPCLPACLPACLQT